MEQTNSDDINTTTTANNNNNYDINKVRNNKTH